MSQTQSSTSGIGDAFSEALQLLTREPIIMVPSVVPALWTFLSPILGLFGPMTLFATGSSSSGLAAMILMIWVFALVYVVLLVASQGITVLMARDARGGHAVSLRSALDEGVRRLGPLLAASAIVAVLVSIGLVAAVLPGLVLVFLFWFVPQTVMIDECGVLEGIRESCRTAIANVGITILVLVISIAIICLVSLIPYVGWILDIPVTAFLTCFTTVVYMDVR